MTIHKHIDFQVPQWGELAAGPQLHPSYPGRVQGDGPRAYWQLNETAGTVAADTMNNHPAIYEGDPSLDQPGPIHRHSDGCVRLAGFGSDQRVVVEPHVDFEVQVGVMLECWVRPEYSSSGHPRIMCSGAGGLGLHLLYTRNDTMPHFRVRFASASLDVTVGHTGTAYEVWYHLLAAVVTGNQVVFFVNGAPASDAGGGSINATADQRLEIGGTGHWLQGRLAHVALYQKGASLTTQQVNDIAVAHYNAGLGRFTRS